MASKKKTLPKHLFLIVPLDDNYDLDFGSRVMEATDTRLSADHLFGDEAAERRPAAIVQIDASTLKILKRHTKTKHSDD